MNLQVNIIGGKLAPFASIDGERMLTKVALETVLRSAIEAGEGPTSAHGDYLTYAILERVPILEGFSERRFPVLWYHKELADNRAKLPEGGLPWQFVEQYEKAIIANHGQNMETLAARGGLAPEELAVAIRGLPLNHIAPLSESLTTIRKALGIE